MKLIRLLLALSLISCASSAHAQVAGKEAPATPIRYSPAIPKSVLKLMPRGAKSLFWGTFSPRKGSAALAIHLFDLAPSEDGILQHPLSLDVFTLKPWKRISHSWVGFARYIPRARKQVTPPLVALNLYWLKKAKQEQPVLKIRCFDPDGFAGPVGEEIIVVFPNGWRGKAIAKALPWGSSNSSVVYYYSNILLYDAEGSLQLDVEPSVQPFTAAPSTGIHGLFRWNGQEWVVK